MESVQELTTNLTQAFYLTTKPSQTSDIKKGESTINQFKEVQGFCPALMIIANNQQNELVIRQAALAELKLVVEYNWLTISVPSKKFIICENDKLVIKNNIIEALVNCIEISQLWKQYEKILNFIIDFDYPKKWEALDDSILVILKNASQFTQLLGALVALHQILKVNQYYMSEDSQLIEQKLTPKFFPVLGDLMDKLLANYNEQTAPSVYFILKSFLSVVKINLSNYFQNQEIIEHWLSVLKLILEQPLSEQLSKQTQDYGEIDKISSHLFWKNKGICGRIILRFLQKHSNPKFAAKDSIGASIFLEKYSIALLEIFIKFLINKKTQFVSPKVTYWSLKYLLYGIRIEKTMLYLQQYFEQILFDIVIHLLFITTDPQDYIAKEEDETICAQNIKNIAIDLVIDFCTVPKTTAQENLLKLVNYAASCFQNKVDPRNGQPVSEFLKEALLWCFGVLRNQIKQLPNMTDEWIENIFEKFIIPELNSTNCFLRARACWTIGKYGGFLEFKNKQNLETAIVGVSKCIQDSQLPIRFKGAITLNCLLSYKETENMLRPELNKILEIYLKLLNEIDNEEIVAALEEIVHQYSDDIVPYAYELVVHLTSSFHKFCNSEKNKEVKDNDDEYEEKQTVLTATGCLEAITRILGSPLPQQVYSQIFTLLIPTINYIFTDEGIDFSEEAFNILNQIIYNYENLTDQMLFYFPVLVYLVIGVPQTTANLEIIANMQIEIKTMFEGMSKRLCSDRFKEMLICLKNFIFCLKQRIFELNDMFKIPFIQLIDGLIEFIFKTEEEVDHLCALELYISLMESNPSSMDSRVQQIANFCLTILSQPKKSTIYQTYIIHCLHICIWYNPKLILQQLHSQNRLTAILEFDLKNYKHFKSQYLKAGFVYGLASCFRVNEWELPEEVKSAIPRILKALVQQSSDVIDLRDKEDFETDEEDEQEDEEEERIAKPGGGAETDQQLDDIIEATQEDIKKYKAKKNKSKIDIYNPNSEAYQTVNPDDDDEADLDIEQLEEEMEDQIKIIESNCQSFLGENDELLFLKNVLEELMKTQTEFYQKITNILNPEEQQTLLNNFEVSKQQFDEYKKHEQEEKLKRQTISDKLGIDSQKK